METVILYRPTGPEELALIRGSNWKKFPPRLPDQSIFYPVLSEEYATQIARDWNARDRGSGYVTRFVVNAEFLNKYEIKQVGSPVHKELWIPAEEIEELNQNIIGTIEVIAEFHKDESHAK